MSTGLIILIVIAAIPVLIGFAIFLFGSTDSKEKREFQKAKKLKQ